MNGFSRLFLGLTFGMFMFIPMSVCAYELAPQSAEGASESSGVYCEINDVKLFATSRDDCEKAGGIVTHSVTTTVIPAETEKE